MSIERVVLDTNVLVSRLIKPSSGAGQAVSLAFRRHLVLTSEALLFEIVDVLSRPKFASTIEVPAARALIRALAGATERIAISTDVDVCRDPKDNHVLALALDGMASVVITGDSDLLALHPFRGIPIVTPRHFLELDAG